MPTRADFYVGNDQDAEWIGSIAFDGFPRDVRDGLRIKARQILHENDYRDRVHDLLISRDDGTTPELGWPWPWDDSQTTDFAYAFMPDSPVLVSCYGSAYVPLKKTLGDDDEWAMNKRQVFPNMSARRVRPKPNDPRDGIMTIGVDEHGHIRFL